MSWTKAKKWIGTGGSILGLAIVVTSYMRASSMSKEARGGRTALGYVIAEIKALLSTNGSGGTM